MDHISGMEKTSDQDEVERYIAGTLTPGSSSGVSADEDNEEEDDDEEVEDGSHD